MTIPTFIETTPETVPTAAARVRETFRAHKTRPVEWRIKQLRKLYWAIDKHEADLRLALERDIGKGQFDAMLGEINWVKNDIVYVTTHLKSWMKDEKPTDIDFANRLVSPRIRKDPYGAVLVIGPFNFPLQLCLCPCIGAIAGGNTIVLKPSESTPNCSAMIQLLFTEALDPDAFTVIQGAIPQTQALLAEKWDKIFFTGSVSTAKIVAKAAAAHLTPTVFELGGKNPAIVTANINVPNTARRLLWAKNMNAGQLCMSPNHVLVERKILPQLITELKSAYAEFYPSGAKGTEDWCKIVNLKSFSRLQKLLDATTGTILLGGETDAEQLYVAPTVVLVKDMHDALLAEETFGPFLTLLPAEADAVLAQTRSGGATINDTLFHAIIPTLDFGGVGDSGMGAYRGRASFDAFVHRRSIAKTPNWAERIMKMRYPPYAGTSKYKTFDAMQRRNVNFDREGNDKVAWWVLVLTLGGRKGVLRWIGLVLATVGLKRGGEGGESKV
ncbi:Beta-apo-4'-carotenal oxygenase [Cyphellophora attinorum]|uniref:Aldehyde dehydrogenase n=1 Tax=Cyphellophora attinorum TaxID=1664694 RepID=A0A0N0NHY3_9EURO|nr:Beta-apo-4'-carotenal oxygenase [Phialophora attinorum]KPI35211.1 Beta-apo-4'-carotenal oxygenase [Phialophora attinorum]